MKERKKKRSADLFQTAPKAKFEAENTSPLLKSDASGNVTCIICRTSIKSANVWKAHSNSKQHKEKVAAAKQLKLTLSNAKPKNAVTPSATPERTTNTTKQESKPDLVYSLRGPAHSEAPENKEQTPKDVLPVQFFDDPQKNASGKKEQNANQEDEWERFQKEIKQMASDGQDVAGEPASMTEQHIDEIDDQIHQWSRVFALLNRRRDTPKNAKPRPTETESLEESAQDDEEENVFNEFSDWRSRNSSSAI